MWFVWNLFELDINPEGSLVEWLIELIGLYFINPLCILGYVVLVMMWIWRLGKKLQKSWTARKKKRK